MFKGIGGGQGGFVCRFGASCSHSLECELGAAAHIESVKSILAMSFCIRHPSQEGLEARCVQADAHSNEILCRAVVWDPCAHLVSSFRKSQKRCPGAWQESLRAREHRKANQALP